MTENQLCEQLEVMDNVFKQNKQSINREINALKYKYEHLKQSHLFLRKQIVQQLDNGKKSHKPTDTFHLPKPVYSDGSPQESSKTEIIDLTGEETQKIYKKNNNPFIRRRTTGPKEESKHKLRKTNKKQISGSKMTR